MGTTALVPVRFRLADLLEESGLTQRELALRSHVSPTTINRIVNNLTAQVSLATLDSLCAALGDAMGRTVAPGELLEREPKRKSKAK